MIPRLIHPVEVVIAQVNGASTTIDADFREPVGNVATTSVTLSGQLAEGRGRSLNMSAGGDTPTANSTGHVVFEIDALTAAGAVLHLGDRITSIAGGAVNHRITRIEDKVHYAGRAWHRWAWFSPE